MLFLSSVTEVEPRQVEDAPEAPVAEVYDEVGDKPINQQDVRDSLTGQTRLFSDDDIDNDSN